MKKKIVKLQKLTLAKATILDMQAEGIKGGITGTACITNPFINYSCRQGCEPDISSLCNTNICPATRIGGTC